MFTIEAQHNTVFGGVYHNVYWQGGRGSPHYPFSRNSQDAYHYPTRLSAERAKRRVVKSYGDSYFNIKIVFKS